MNFGEKNDIESIKKDQLSNKSILMTAAFFYALSKNRFAKVNQLKSFDWIEDAQFDLINDELSKHLSKKIVFEQETYAVLTWSKIMKFSRSRLREIDKNSTLDSLLENEIKVSGKIDVYDKKQKTIWNFKFADSLKEEHIMQLACYGYLKYGVTKGFFKKRRVKKIKYKLMNLKTNEIIEVKINFKKAKEFLFSLVDFKMKDPIALTKSEFISKCQDIIKKYIG